MAPFTRLFIVLAVAAFQLEAYAAPLAGRAALGNFVQCNAARLKTVKALAASTTAVGRISPGANDDATIAAVDEAKAGLKDARNGIATIAKALIAGQAPPANARDQVGQGLNAAQTALDSIALNNPKVTSQVSNAQEKLQQTISAGQQVVDTCGGGGAEGASLSSIATVSMTATEVTTVASATPTALEAALTSVASDAATTTSAATATATESASAVSLTASASESLLTDCATASQVTVTSTVTVTTTVDSLSASASSTVTASAKNTALATAGGVKEGKGATPTAVPGESKGQRT